MTSSTPLRDRDSAGHPRGFPVSSPTAPSGRVPVEVSHRLHRRLPPVRRPGSVRDGSGQLVVLEHATHIQIFDHDRLVFADESSGEFVQVIVSSISDSCVYSSNCPPCLNSISRTSGLAGKPPLREGEALPVPGLMLRVGDFLSNRQRYQAREPNIQPDRSGRARQRFDRPVLHEQADEPATRAVAGYVDCGRLRAFRKWPGPYDGQRFRHLRKPQLAVPEIKGRSSAKPDTPESSRQFHFLRGRGVEAILVRSPHRRRWHVEHATEWGCTYFTEPGGRSGKYLRPRRRSLTMGGK